MTAVANRLRVAAIQAAPEFLDPTATVEKAIRLIETAAGEGAALVAFGEGFLPGHPIWLHVLPVTSPAQIAFASRLVDGAITIPGPETARIAEVCRRLGVHVVMPVVERIEASSSRIALAAIVVDADGVVRSRRKLVPAVGERVLFTPGGAESICVFPTPWGPLSVLLGGENSNPLLTWTLRELGARIHVAAWPPHFNKPGVMGETATITGRAIAYQNSAYVISVAGATTPAIRESMAPGPEALALLETMAADPASTIYAPRGSLVAGPLPGGDGILHADLDLGAGTWAGLVNRQYDRPDLIRVSIDAAEPAPALAFERTPRGGEPDPLADGDPRDTDALRDRARALIEARYARTLLPEDRERLVPYVAGLLGTSGALARLDPDAPRT